MYYLCLEAMTARVPLSLMGSGLPLHLHVVEDLINVPTLDPLSSAQSRRAKVMA